MCNSDEDINVWALIAAAVTTVSIFVGSVTLVGFVNYGDGGQGQFTGRVVDVKRAGWICKTDEVTILVNDGNASIQKTFTVETNKGLDFLKDAIASNKKVVVKYDSPRIVSKCRSSTDAIVTDVEVL